MKKRLLFVDDEPLVLDGLKRLLHPMRGEWEMEFVDGGELAQECVVRRHYDVMLTDMVMPRIDGAQLLAFTKERAPKTIRLVLSGRLEQRLAMKCVGVAHQWLAKPCEANLVKQTITRVTDPGFGDRNERVMALAMQLERLPSVPEVYSDMMQMLSDPSASLEDVGAVLERDLALTAKVLHVANSAFFGLAHRVSRPAEAAAFLGMDTLKSLVLATDIFSQFAIGLPRGFSAARVSKRSRRVGAVARLIAKIEGASREILDEALCAGLLSDVGMLVLASSRPSQFQEVVSLELPRVEAERKVYGATHAEVGGYLLGLWGLPPPVAAAVGFHHSPGESSDAQFSAITAVHVADHLVAELSHELPSARLDRDYLVRLGLLGRLPLWRAAADDLPPFDFG